MPLLLQPRFRSSLKILRDSLFIQLFEWLHLSILIQNLNPEPFVVIKNDLGLKFAQLMAAPSLQQFRNRDAVLIG